MSSERWFYVNQHRRKEHLSRTGFRRRRNRRWNELLKQAPLEITADLIANPDFLVECFRMMRDEKGHGAGIDGVRVPELLLTDVGRFAKSISEAIREGHYRPQPTQQHRIPKESPGQYRELSIPTVMDRVVAMALNEALSTVWEPKFTDSVWAYRPGRGVWPMLAKLLNTMEDTGRSVLVIDDIAQAFDRVPIGPLLEIHRRHFEDLQPPDPMTLRYHPNEIRHEYSDAQKTRARRSLLQLVRRVLTGAVSSRQRGIPQGGNYSPTALNVLLHEHLDQPIVSKSRDALWYRYSDNLTYLAHSVTEGDEILATIRDLLAPLGMKLKGATEDGVRDLTAGAEAHLLGFTIRHNGQGPVL